MDFRGMPDLLTTFTLSESIQFIHWFFSRWQEVQASLTSEQQPYFLPADDLELSPHQLGRDERVCALGCAQQNVNRRQRTPQERYLPGGRGRPGQVNNHKPMLTSNLPKTYSGSLFDGWGLVSKVILREPHDVQSWLTFVHSVQSVHTMAIHPNMQVGSKLLLCSAGRGTCHLQAKLSKLQRQTH